MALTKKNYYKQPPTSLVANTMEQSIHPNDGVLIDSSKPFKIETSWDDGFLLDLKVATLLKKYNMTGVFYIIVDRIGESGYLSWDQVKDLERQGFEIGSHTMSHPSDMKALYEEQLHYEVQNSKDMIETVLGHKIAKFCYPRGRFNEVVQAKVAESGYIEARATGMPGILEVKDKLAIPGTVHIFQRPEYKGVNVLDFAKQIIDRAVKEGGYVNIWGHSKEVDENKLWDVLEEVLAYASSKMRG